MATLVRLYFGALILDKTPWLKIPPLPLGSCDHGQEVQPWKPSVSSVHNDALWTEGGNASHTLGMVLVCSPSLFFVRVEKLKLCKV